MLVLMCGVYRVNSFSIIGRTLREKEREGEEKGERDKAGWRNRGRGGIKRGGRNNV